MCLKMCYFVFYADIRCELLASVPFGHYTNQSCVKQKSRYEAICQLACDVGSTLHGNQVQTCTESDWSPEVTGHCESKPFHVYGLGYMYKNVVTITRQPV